MSSTLKRKRGVSAGLDSVAQTNPGTSSSLTNTAVRAHLEQSLLDLRATTTRLEGLLAVLPSSSPPLLPTRTALAEVQSPAQPTSPKPTSDPTKSSSSAPTKACSACANLEQQLSALRTQYDREREAWKAFKAWWLGSLEKRERRRAQRRGEVAGASGGQRQSDDASSSGGQGQGEGEAERLSRLVGKLDEGTRDVWVRAGIVPSDGVGSASRDAQEESELALPLHPSNVANSIPAPASVETPRVATKPPPPSRDRPRPTITNTNRPSTIRTNLTAPTRPPPTTTAPYIDDTPIRNPHHRRTLHASDCPDCSLFYAHLNDFGAANGGGALRQGDVERMACSRHRSTFARADTPEGYWNIGFPSTQEVELINAAARRGRYGGAAEGRRG